eukprot:scaffold216525_cov25-Tisochrysis_lutea.AAC.3
MEQGEGGVNAARAGVTVPLSTGAACSAHQRGDNEAAQDVEQRLERQESAERKNGPLVGARNDAVLNQRGECTREEGAGRRVRLTCTASRWVGAEERDGAHGAGDAKQLVERDKVAEQARPVVRHSLGKPGLERPEGEAEEGCETKKVVRLPVAEERGVVRWQSGLARQAVRGKRVHDEKDKEADHHRNGVDQYERTALPLARDGGGVHEPHHPRAPVDGEPKVAQRLLALDGPFERFPTGDPRAEA